MYTSLEISKRIEVFTLKIYGKLVNFPKAEKFALCSEIKENLYNLYQYTSRANYVKSKRLYYAQEAEAHLTTVRFLFKIAKERKYISLGFYKEIDLDLTEISKMLTGYIKSVISK